MSAPLTLLLLLLGPASSVATQPAPSREVRVLQAARQIMTAARYCTLVTVDQHGQPRARTVDPRPPGDSMVVFIVTSPLTRKVAQIEGDSRVTLHYFDEERAETVTLLGRARIHRDRATIERYWLPTWNDHYPKRPAGAVLIEVTPLRIEVLGRGLDPDSETWEPQGIDLRVAVER